MALCYFDLETTGLSTTDDEIVSITASCGDKLFDSLVKPRNPIPVAASRVHKIFDADVANAEPWNVVGMNFLNWLHSEIGQDITLVAYNGASFDVPFLLNKNNELDKDAAPKFDNIWLIDPLPIAQKLIDRRKSGSHRQAAVYKHLYGAEPEGQHSSLGDVQALQKISEHELFAPHMETSKKKLVGFFF